MLNVVSGDTHNCRSSERYWMASAMWSGRMLSDSARSAIILEILRILSWERAEKASSRIADFRRAVAAAVMGQAVRRFRWRRWALQERPSGLAQRVEGYRRDFDILSSIPPIPSSPRPWASKSAGPACTEAC